MSKSSIDVQQYVSSVASLVEKFAYLDKQTSSEQKNECRWEIGAVLSPGTCGDRKADGCFIDAVSKQLNARYERGFGAGVIKDCIAVSRAFPEKDKLNFTLTWSHYRTLTREPDYGRRLQLLGKAVERKWSPDSLASRIAGISCGYGLHFECCDALIIDLARAYSCACGIISATELKSIYQELSASPVDDYDFQETLLHMDEVSHSDDDPCLWKRDEHVYVIDRSLSDPSDLDKNKLYLDEYYGWNNTYARPASFLGALRRTYASFVRQRRLELVEAHRQIPLLRLEAPAGGSEGLSSLLNWRSVEHLREYCIGDIGDGRGCRNSCRASFDQAVELLARHVSQNGIPSSTEVLEDARFLLVRTDYSRDRWDRHENRSASLVAEFLGDIYRKLPLWEKNGRTAQELEDTALDSVA